MIGFEIFNEPNFKYIINTKPKNKMNTTWVYINSEPGLWTVGFYDPSGKWHSDEDYPNKQMAADRVHYLNGGELESDRPAGGFDKPSNIFDR